MGQGGGGSGRSVGPAPRLTWFDWTESKVDPLRVTTGEGAGTPVTPEEHVRHCLGMDEADQRHDERPTLVYFHWPHEHATHGKTITTLCGRVLDDEQSARWGRLFRCVQVDMAASDERLVKILGDVDKPQFMVLSKDGKVVANIPAVNTSLKFQKALEAAHAKFPEESKRVQKEIAEQAKTLVKARTAAKADKLEDALLYYDEIRSSDVRIGPEFDRAAQEATDLQARLQRQQAKEAGGAGGEPR